MVKDMIKDLNQNAIPQIPIKWRQKEISQIHKEKTHRAKENGICKHRGDNGSDEAATQ